MIWLPDVHGALVRVSDRDHVHIHPSYPQAAAEVRGRHLSQALAWPLPARRRSWQDVWQEEAEVVEDAAAVQKKISLGMW